MARGATALVTDLGDLFSVQIDPTWPYIHLWGEGDGFSQAPTKLSVTFMDLEEGISEQAQANYADQDIIGRAESIKTYISTSSREVPLTFRFRAQGLIGTDNGERVGGSSLSGFGDVQNALRVNSNGVAARDDTAASGLSLILEKEVRAPALWLDALQYPVIDEAGISHGPPPVILTIGQLLMMRCVVTSCAINWESSFDPETMLPFGASVSVSFSATHTRVGNRSFKAGPWRFAAQRLNGVDGQANPQSGLGSGRSGTDVVNPSGVQT